MVNVNIADENDKIIRNQRDGNVMMTGCKKFDKLVENLSNFSKKIVAMLYNTKSKGNDITMDDKKVNEENNIKSDDDANPTDEIVDGSNPLGVQEDIVIVREVNQGNADNTGDLIHMDFLPIS